MASGLEENAVMSLIRSKLNSERIKLWIPPYSDEEGNRAEFTLELVKRFAQELHMAQEEVETAVENLRVSSIERLGARNRFLETGVAVLKVKTAAQRGSKMTLTIETKLDISGAELRRLVAAQLKVDAGSVKVIASGSILSDEVTLKEQGINPSSAMMAIVMTTTSSASATAEDEANRNQSVLKETRDDAEILAANAETTNNDDESLMTIADQGGRPLDIPRTEKKALSMAMILNEKGKSALKRHEYSKALLLFLEADKEFRKCSTSLLSAVDNYALLCLDITWCYLCLRSIEDLPDAETRLKTCEECLQRSYGANLERLKAVKGATGGEATILVRLNLMKGIAAYYKRQWNVASTIFAKVEDDLKQLKVDDGKLSEVMSLGYTAAEARLGLRNTSGNVEMAVNFIINKKEEKIKRFYEEKEKEKKNKLARKLGHTANGEWINYDHYQALLNMGMPKGAAREALAQSNNNVSIAVQIIQDHPELLKSVEEPEITDEMVAQVVSCGFALDVARGCLDKHKGNVRAAIEELVATGGLLLQVMDTSDTNNAASNLANNVAALERQALLDKEKEALDRLRADITDDEDAHLDATLDEETVFLDEYRRLLQFAQR